MIVGLSLVYIAWHKLRVVYILIPNWVRVTSAVDGLIDILFYLIIGRTFDLFLNFRQFACLDFRWELLLFICLS